MKNRFETFAICIMELNRCLQKIKDTEMKRFGLRANHAMCLYYLGRNSEGLTVTQLTNLCRVDKAAVSRSLSQLMEKEFVYCNPAQNKRSYRTPHYLTPKGEELVTLMNRRIEAALVNVGNGLSQSQRKIFYETMELILANLTEYLNANEETF